MDIKDWPKRITKTTKIITTYINVNTENIFADSLGLGLRSSFPVWSMVEICHTHAPAQISSHYWGKCAGKERAF